MKLRTQAELELRQGQRLEAVGRLASGVAHEINTPLQFISDSVRFAQEATNAVLPLLARYDAALRAPGSGISPETLKALDDAAKDAELDYMRVELPDALGVAREGLVRVAAIVASMKEFAHPAQQAQALVDINRAVTTTLAVAAHEYKYVADVVTDLGDIEEVHGRAGEIHQVLLNLVVNAAHAVEDVVKAGGPRGTISIRTRSEGDDVVIAVRDTGAGIPLAVQEKIYDPFFTTKEVGRGSGQGLAITRSIVVGKHGGKLTFESEESVGTTFVVRLPLRPPSSSRGQAA
jgi:two-component system NtrC family sensor kinase